MSDPEDGILAISLSDSDAEAAGAAREARKGQSAGAFEAVKRAYEAKIEEGEVRFRTRKSCPSPRRVDVNWGLARYGRASAFR